MTRLVSIGCTLLSLATTHAAAPDFTRDVQPLFALHCLKCHGPEEQNAGLRYDHPQGAFTEADSGARAIVPGAPEKSELLKRITSTHKEEQMPPKGARLSPQEIETLRQWIAAGAEWPANSLSKTEVSAAPKHWSFQPIQNPPLPTVRDRSWPLNPIDHFIQAKREAAGLRPVPDAEPHVLARRLSYDLTGLPPQKSPGSDYNQEVEHLLASPAYGERWGRHWLDWVRYADTAGDNSDFPIPQAYLYRNYVIQSLQDDVPYDRFLTEQLAGDLLPAQDQAEKNRLTIATGYLAMARRFGSLLERYPQHLTIEDTIDNLGRTVLGLTLSCARCHDHKFDPISTRDYYGLYGIFASTRYPMPGLELFQTQRDFVPLLPAEETAETMRPFEKDRVQLTAELDRLLNEANAKSLDNAQRERNATVDEQRRRKGELDRLLMRVRKAGEKLAAHLKKMPVIPTAYAVQDDKPIQARVQLKGEPDRPGSEVPRKFPDILGGQTLPPSAQSTSGRLQLAQWITDKRNPLTARVIVNRVWQRHFVRGLVPSTSDFGLRGETPTHPELLDWLATDFMNHGWSLKHLHRLILTSRTYRLSSQDQEDNLTSDPGNALYWKFNRQRLDAESLRDTLLLIGGTLDPTPQTQPYPIPPSRDWEYTQHHPFKADYPSNKRSVYQLTKRLTAQTYLQTFDGPDPNVCTATRDTSVTALQALYFVNNSFLHDQAQRFATQLVGKKNTDEARLDQAYRTLFQRPPSAEETQLLIAHLALAREQTSDDTAAWASLCRSLLRLNEFLYLD